MVNVATWIDKEFKRLGEELKAACARIARLEDELSLTRKRVAHWQELDMKWQKIVSDYLEKHDDELDEAQENIKQLLLKVFPGVALDISHARRIVGDLGELRNNSLDKREPPSKD